MKALLTYIVTLVGWFIAFVSCVMGLYALFFGYVSEYEDNQPGGLIAGIGAATLFYGFSYLVLKLSGYITVKIDKQ